MEYSLLVVGLLLIPVYYHCTAIYQIYFHPLARYSGSYVAAVSSSWYEWYWNYLLNGRMLFEIERLHQLHGPVVRIGPNDLSVNDPEIFMDMTRVSSGFTKDPNLYRWISLPGTSIGETNPESHRIRRKVLTPALSGSRVNELAPFISTKVEQLLDRFDILSRDSLLVDFDSAWKALTMDIISKVVLGQDINCVKQPGFKNDFTDQFRQALSAGWFPTAFPTISTLALNLSSTFLSRIIPNPMMDFRRQCRVILNQYFKRFDPGSSSPDEAVDLTMSVAQRSPVIDMLMGSSTVKGHTPLALDELNDEAVTLLIAGSDTTSNSMLCGIYRICSDIPVHDSLVGELQAAFPSLDTSITYEQAKGLPYLTAVIKETLRLGVPLPGRLPRLVPPEGYSLHGQDLPPKTSIHMSAYLLNRHPDIWRNPDRFDPSRWLEDDSQELDKYLTTFNRGPRQCLGKDLAWCELWVLLANLFRRYSIEFEEPDVRWTDLGLINYTKCLQGRLKKRES